MKTLKGLLIAILALGMSTGFSETTYAAKMGFRDISGGYETLTPEAQAEADKLLNEYCETGDIKPHINFDAKLLDKWKKGFGYATAGGAAAMLLPKRFSAIGNLGGVIFGIGLLTMTATQATKDLLLYNLSKDLEVVCDMKK